MLRDAHNRTIRDLRISLTDRCNFRCFYCLPNGEPPLARKETILTFEEIAYLSEIFVSLGIEKIRLTGGEPLIRKDVPSLVRELAKLKPSLHDLALTTNGFDFPRHAAALKEAGLDRVTLSLDSLDRDKFLDITGVDALDKVYKSIEAAKELGFDPVKINACVVRGRNDDELVDFARFAREYAISMRFIEFMPLDSGHEWSRDLVVSGKEIYAAINAVFPLRLKETSRGSETSWKYEFADGSPGEIGIIAPVTEMFCGACSRIRLTADGQIRTCLFSTTEHNLRDVLRSGASREEIIQFIEDVVMKKEPRHYINDAEFTPASRTMSFIGG
ncbi:MAG: GTP 3',8-cyclase MoaA [Acidobacteria bacterium]|nr:GTP 3',8-cyclase MoaA [Acidobacteriota bacterium]MBP7474153.1 GTP 3',8-cyclase MoaA [Pyrinomonadaceae bacterium]MBP9109053.1 GTP 3',8-cyclase MoaA [Pyrinomonadaceae bacterium]